MRTVRRARPFLQHHDRQENRGLTRQNETADITILKQVTQMRAKVTPSLARHGIELLRPVKDQPGQMAVLLDDEAVFDCLVTHDSPQVACYAHRY